MSEDWKEPSRKRPTTARKNTDIMFSELEAKFLTIARSASGEALSRKAIKGIESLIDDYYKRWKK